MNIKFIDDEPMTNQLTLSKTAHEDILRYMDQIAEIALPYDQAFEILDEMYGGLIPQEDLGNGTYEWVCNYSGGKFYAEVEVEDSLWLSDGI